MRVAMPCTDQDEIFSHFGHADQFAVYEYESGDYVDKKVFTTKCQGHDQLAQLMRYLQINIVVCDGIGDGALEALKGSRILVYAGVKGSTDKAYYDLVANRLICTSRPTCKSSNCSCGSGKCSCGCC